MSRYLVISVEMVVSENPAQRVFGDVVIAVKLGIIRELVR